MSKIAKIELIVTVSDSNLDTIRDLEQLKRDIQSGTWQRELNKTGVRKVTATFEWLEK